MNELTQQQKNILERLSAYIQEKGYAPSQRELAKLAGLKSPNTVDYHLKNLEKKGLVKCSNRRFRAIEVPGEMGVRPSGFKIPLLGSVPAGPLNLAAAEQEDFIEVDPSLVKGRSMALRVRGDSMKDAGILEGDVVVVRIQPTAQDGDIVVARLEDEATVKYFRRMTDGIYLVPANAHYKPFPLRGAEIAGKVTGVIRRY